MGNNKSIQTHRSSLPNRTNQLLSHLIAYNILKRNSNKSKSSSKLSKASLKTEQSEYISINESNSETKPKQVLDNYFSIDDDEDNDEQDSDSYKANSCINKKSSCSLPNRIHIESNLYSKISNHSSSKNLLNKKHIILLNYHKLLHKLTKNDFKSKILKQGTSPPMKSFDPNEEFYGNNHEIYLQPPRNQPPPLPDNNLYSEMSDSLFKFKLDSLNDDNYQSVHEQYDYILNTSCLSEKEMARNLNESLYDYRSKIVPPPLPPASTQPSRNHVMSQIYTTIEPMSINNQVYYSFTSDFNNSNNSKNEDSSLLFSSSSVVSTNSSLTSNEIKEECLISITDLELENSNKMIKI